MTGVAVIGCGQWGPNHIRNFQAEQDSLVLFAVDSDPAKLDRMRALYPAVKGTASLAEATSAAEVTAVVVATPVSSHFEIVRQALSAGKHVLCEKPLCETVSEAEELVKLAKEHKRILMVGHVFLFNPGIIKLKEFTDKGELGHLYYLSAVRTNLGPIRKDCNAAFDLATHDVSIFNWLLDSEPIEVSATGASFLQANVEDVVSISMKYPDNVFATIQASWLNPKKVRQITVVGSQQMVTWDDLQLGAPVACYDKRANLKVQYADYGEFLRVSTWEGDVRLPRVGTEEPLKMQTRYFLNAVQKGSIQISDGNFAVGVMRTLQAIACSLQQKGKPCMVHS
jgi:predicted dehydrogenase